MADPLSPESLSELYVEAYIAAIKGFCRLEGINQEHFARSIGVTSVQLSYILRRRRNPGAKFARGIEGSSYLPADFKEGVLNSIWAAQHYRDQEMADLLYRAANQPLAELVVYIEQEYTLVGHGQIEPEKARAIHQRLYRDCKALIARLDYARSDPLAYIRLCTIQSEIGCVLNRLYDSLGAALLAERVANELSGTDDRSLVRELRSPQTNAIRAKGVVYYNLHLYDQAYAQFAGMEETPAVKDDPATWLPHIARDKVKALARATRFNISDAERYAWRGRDACAGPTWDADIGEMLSFLIDLSLVRCYINYGGTSNLRKANAIMRGYLDALEGNRIRAATPLHRVLFYKGLAEVEQAMGGYRAAADNPAQVEALRIALRIAGQAGLLNQLQKLRFRYGTAALKLAEEEGIELA